MTFIFMLGCKLLEGKGSILPPYLHLQKKKWVLVNIRLLLKE